MADNPFKRAWEKYRRRAGYKNWEIAQFLFIEKSTLSKWINLANPWPAASLELACERLGVNQQEKQELFDLAGQVEIAPPEPQSPPELEGFVGRKREIGILTGLLEKNHVAVITGMPGVGKTMVAAMAARLAAPLPKIFWYTFHEGEEIKAVLWKLAAFLAFHGKPEVWEMVQRPQTGKHAPPFETLFDYILQLASDQEFLVCLDDFQFVEDDPLLLTFIKRLIGKLKGSSLKLLIVSRHRPMFATNTVCLDLEGLTVGDLRLLLEKREPLTVENPDEFIQELHAATGGNAQFLMLALNVLSEITYPASLLNHLAEEEDIGAYLLREVDRRLGETERSALRGLSILMGYPGSLKTIETIQDQGNILQALTELQKRSLLTVQRTKSGKTYTLHALIRTFYYGSLSLGARREGHRRAGEYYEWEEAEPFLAAIHYEQAGAFEQAADLASEDVEATLNQGHARELKALLERLGGRKISVESVTRVKLALGYIQARQGESSQARRHFQEALDALATLPQTPETQHLKTLVYYRLGEILQVESPAKALTWIDQGLEIEGSQSTPLAARLLLLKGEISAGMGNFQTALKVTKQAQAVLSDADAFMQIHALINLGHIYDALGEIQKGVQYSEQALALSRSVGDHFRTISILNNLSIGKFYQGEWEQAITYNEEALHLVETLGSVFQQVDLGINLGWMYIQKGEDERAEQSLMKALRLTQELKHREPELQIHTNLGDLYLRQGNLEAAAAHLAEAEQLSDELQNPSEMPEIYRNHALICLEHSQLSEARDYIERSLALTRKMEATAQEGMSLRVLGQVQTAEGQLDLAQQSFQQSLTLLAGDPYESARTRAEWGQILLANGNQEGLPLVQEASATFQRLGAIRDLR